MVLEFAAFIIAKNHTEKKQFAETPTQTGFGCMKGMFKMAPDFDEPLEDFKDYL